MRRESEMIQSIKVFEKIGVVAVHIEDQISQKRCGHLDNKELITTEKMVKKIKQYNNFKIPKSHQKSILLIGNFDGFHLGHQKLFELAKQYKKKNK